jgi:hypothetical protein
MNQPKHKKTISPQFRAAQKARAKLLRSKNPCRTTIWRRNKKSFPAGGKQVETQITSPESPGKSALADRDNVCH